LFSYKVGGFNDILGVVAAHPWSRGGSPPPMVVVWRRIRPVVHPLYVTFDSNCGAVHFCAPYLEKRSFGTLADQKMDSWTVLGKDVTSHNSREYFREWSRESFEGLKQITQNGQGIKTGVVIQCGCMHVATWQACRVGEDQPRKTYSMTVCGTPVVDFQRYNNHEPVYEMSSSYPTWKPLLSQQVYQNSSFRGRVHRNAQHRNSSK